MTESVPTGESIAALIIVPLLIIGLFAAAYLLRRWARSHDFDLDFERRTATAGWITCLVGAVIAAVSLWWGMYPWKWEYHEWRPVSGVVDTVDSRLLPASSGMEEKFVVKFQGNDQQYGVLDTRAAGLKSGDRLTITCVRRWQWSGTHGYDCNFVDLERR